MELNYDLSLTEIPVKIKDTSGNVREFILREATDEAQIKWRNSMMGKSYAENDRYSIGEVAESDSILICSCLFEIFDRNGQKKEASVKMIQLSTWPSRVTKDLAEKIKNISGLREEQETIEFLEKRIDQDTRKLKKMKEEGEDAELKKSSNGGEED